RFHGSRKMLAKVSLEIATLSSYLKKDRISDGERRKRIKPHAVPGETTVECVAHRFHLRVVTKHPLFRSAVVFGWREEAFERVVEESVSKVGARAEMSGDDRKSRRRCAV